MHSTSFIPASPTWWGRSFWELFSRLGAVICFRELKVVQAIEADPERAMLLLGNHISWWDGFWPLELNRRMWKKKYYIMMLEAQLRPRPLFRRGGAFSIRPGHRSVLESIHYSCGLLQQPENLVVIYPQGAIRSLYTAPIHFEQGVWRILQKTRQAVQLVFSVALLDYGSHPLPGVYYYFQEIAYSHLVDHDELQEVYNHFYQSVVNQHSNSNDNGNVD